jgi:RNA polymerase sigma-70 factor (ECF subfamily)
VQLARGFAGVPANAAMELEETTEMRLIRNWRSGDRNAGDKLLRRYTSVLERFFARRVAHNVDDLVQRTLLACTQAVDRFEGRSSFKSYLLGIAQYQLLMSLRVETSSPVEAPTLSTRPDESPSQLAAFRQEQLILVSALIKLEPEFRRALTLFYWGGLSVEQIAEELGVRPGTVKSRLSRGREMIRERLMTMKLRDDVRAEALRELVEWTASRRE